ncbi:MAG: substrate-binding domain-containing protein [Clostridia bacterium]|nr:substrate-binding domain-containing protein [Clostridia bacterium]
MKTNWKRAVMVGLAAAMMGTVGCKGEKNILVIGRQAGSGTRSAFEEMVSKNGATLQSAVLTEYIEEYGDTGAVIGKVETNKTAIGYISLSELNDRVKAIGVDGAAATVENVQSGRYQMKRPFLLLTPTKHTLTAAAQDFFDFCMSEQGKEQVIKGGCVAADREYAVYDGATAISGEIVVQGSTSMRDIMTGFIGAYAKRQPDVKVTATYDGSSGGRKAVQNDRIGKVIGLASALKEADGYEEHTLCFDAIAVIVNKNNQIENVTVEQLFDVYTGEIEKFSQMAGNE